MIKEKSRVGKWYLLMFQDGHRLHQASLFASDLTVKKDIEKEWLFLTEILVYTTNPAHIK